MGGENSVTGVWKNLDVFKVRELASFPLLKCYYFSFLAAIIMFLAALILFLIPVNNGSQDEQNLFEEAINRWRTFDKPNIFTTSKFKLGFENSNILIPDKELALVQEYSYPIDKYFAAYKELFFLKDNLPSVSSSTNKRIKIAS